MSETSANPDVAGGNGGLSTDLLAAEGVAAAKRTQEDIAMVSRAVRLGWGVKKKAAVVERMEGIVQKTSVQVATMEGEFQDEARADSNAIAAARVLVAMDGADQTDHWNEDKNARIDAGKPTELVQGVEFIVPGLPERAGE